MMLRREVCLPAEVVFGSSTKEGEVSSYGGYVDQLRNRLQRAHEVARKHLGIAAQRRKTQHDGKMSFYRYSSGDYVWYLAKKAPNSFSPMKGHIW